MRRRLRKLCYGIERAEFELSAGVFLARALLFGFVGLWLASVVFLLVLSLSIGWTNARWLAVLIGLGVLGAAALALIHASAQPAHHRYALRHRRAGKEEL